MKKRSRPVGLFRLHVLLTSILVLGAGLLVGTNVVAADSIQVQSYQRSSEAAECPNQSWETPWQADWGPDSSWTPSWEQWANNGTGGWTCTRTIVWARSPSSTSSSRTYNIGDIGPGGGLVFLKSGGLTYEMAPKNWSGGASDPTAAWCNNTNLDVTGATGTAIGTGSANTTAMVAACTSGAGNEARVYTSGGFNDWFLPSIDELTAMCNYSRNPTSPSTGACSGAQDATFAAGDFGFAATDYWSSSQITSTNAPRQNFSNGAIGSTPKGNLVRIRPIRAF